MSWLIDKLQSGRVSMTVKELKLDIDSADDTRRAKILLKAHEARIKIIESSGIQRDVLANPQNYPRSTLMNIVHQLEDVILLGERQLKGAVSHFKAITGGDCALTSAEYLLMRRGLQVWIATLGAREEHTSDLTDIWDKLRNSRYKLEPVYNEIVSLEKLTAGMSEPGLIGPLNEYIEICSFVPPKYNEPETLEESLRKLSGEQLRKAWIQGQTLAALSLAQQASAARPPNRTSRPVFMFTDVNSFFRMQCKYGDTKIELNKGVVAIVLDAGEIAPGVPPIKVEPDGSQTAAIRVASEDGGFIVLAKAPAGHGDVLKPGDAVMWVPSAYSEQVAAASPDKRSGWVGLIRAKIKTEVGDVGSNWEIICRYP